MSKIGAIDIEEEPNVKKDDLIVLQHQDVNRVGMRRYCIIALIVLIIIVIIVVIATTV